MTDYHGEEPDLVKFNVHPDGDVTVASWPSASWNDSETQAQDVNPSPVNGADIAELTRVVERGFAEIAHLFYQHLPLRKKLWWRLTDFLAKRG